MSVLELQRNMILHLKTLKRKFNHYLTDCKDKNIQKLISNPFIANVSEVPDEIHEEIIKMQH